MCGIAGYFGPGKIDDGKIKRALETMRRRGPDGEAFEIVSGSAGGAHNAVLLHSRLRIIDLDPRANQPFSYKNKKFIFNGELYNYIEVRAELEKQGHIFKTSSDTEVFLYALDAWGMEALDKCEGMWSFALYNGGDGSLTLCRDRFGEKPLYYYLDGRQGVYFASEIKAIKALSGDSFSLNDTHLYRYLVNGYKSLYKQPATFFNNIGEIPAASWVRFSASGRQTTHKYWQPQYAFNEGMNFQDAVSGAREKLIRSVELRLRADVPLAFCMSGGVDSNSLISIARRELDYDVHGFTIANTDSRYDEQDLVEASVRELGIRHTSIPLNTANFLEKLRELVRYHDAPVYTITYYVHWLLQEAMAKAGYKISISGTSADELFTGYYDHHNFYLHAVRNNTPLYKKSLENWKRNIAPVVRNPFLQNADIFIENPFERGHIYLDAAGFSDFLCAGWSEPFFERYYRTDCLLRNRMLNEIFHEATPVILHEDDLNAMYFSIENRSPFLDRALFEFCSSIPTAHLIQNGTAKYVLREAMRGIVPDIIIDNPTKIGFNAPIDGLLDLNDTATREEILKDSPIYDYVRRDRIEELIKNRNMPNSKSKFLFYFVSCKMFLEENW